MPLSDTTREAAARLVARYPMSRSALLPLLHLVQAEHGYVSDEGIAFCAEQLALTKAEVGAVATFYTMFKRVPVGDWLLSVCTNPVCKIAGGQTIYEGYRERCGGGHRNEQGTVTVEHAECLGICDGAPVVQVNYEMYGPLEVDEAMDLFDACAKGEPPPSNWSKEKPGTFSQVHYDLSGAADGTDEYLIAAAREQAASAVPPALRSGETDIPVTHPGGDPHGVGGALLREAQQGDRDRLEASTEVPDGIGVQDQPGESGAVAARTGPGRQSTPDVVDRSGGDSAADDRARAASDEAVETAGPAVQDQPGESGAAADRSEPAGTMTPVDATERSEDAPDPSQTDAGTSPPGVDTGAARPDAEGKDATGASAGGDDDLQEPRPVGADADEPTSTPDDRTDDPTGAPTAPADDADGPDDGASSREEA